MHAEARCNCKWHAAARCKWHATSPFKVPILFHQHAMARLTVQVLQGITAAPTRVTKSRTTFRLMT